MSDCELNSESYPSIIIFTTFKMSIFCSSHTLKHEFVLISAAAKGFWYNYQDLRISTLLIDC